MHDRQKKKKAKVTLIDRNYFSDFFVLNVAFEFLHYNTSRNFVSNGGIRISIDGRDLSQLCFPSLLILSKIY